MKKAVLIIGLGMVFGLALGGCKGRKACETAAQCAVGESCVFFHAENGLHCAKICQADSDCPKGERCQPGAATCQACQDMLRICK